MPLNLSTGPHVLIVDDETAVRQALSTLLAAERFSVATADTLSDARRQIQIRQPDIVLLDLQLPDGDGMGLIAELNLLANCDVALITGYATVDSSIRALQLGASDYLVKPIGRSELLAALSRFSKRGDTAGQSVDYEAELERAGGFGRMRGRSEAMRLVYQLISRVAGTGMTVFVTGESGTGKELIAQTVHDFSPRRDGPFLAVNCGAISPHLIESEIFGHEKGSFTGADRQHLGLFERARGGTLFLDEVTEMPLDLQVKLLRVLESGQFMRVGSTQPLKADVRIIAATNRVPSEAVAEGKLREDLFYRLNVFPVALPPLRDRLDDVPLLAQSFLELIGEREGAVKRFSPDVWSQLHSQLWPGNVRELRNVVQRSYVMSDGPVVESLWVLPLPVPLIAKASAAAKEMVVLNTDSVVLRPGCSVAEAEQALIVLTLRHFHHHKVRAAAALGISLKTLYSRLKEYSEQ